MAPRNNPREMSEVVPRRITTAAQLAAGPIAAAAAAAVAATRAANVTDVVVDTDVAVDETPVADIAVDYEYSNDFVGIPGLVPAAAGEGISEGEGISGNINAPFSVREASDTSNQRHDLPAAMFQGDQETSTAANMEGSCHQPKKLVQPVDTVDTADVDVCSLSTRSCRPKRNTQAPDRFDPEHIPAARRTPTFADCPCEVCEHIDDVEGVVCDRCDKVTHLRCLSPPLLTRPKGSW